MKIQHHPPKRFFIIALALLFFVVNANGQYQSFRLSPQGDTLNAIDKNNLKQGKWVTKVAELRGEPGYEEEGFYKDDKKSGPWRRYNDVGDILAIENYKFGGKEGIQEYFSFLGDIQKHEEWKGYNPNAPFDTIPVYGQGNNEIRGYKIVKAQQYSVPHGEWRYYAAGGRIINTEQYDRGQLLKKPTTAVAIIAPADSSEAQRPKEKVKTPEILEYEKKYSKKKRNQLERVGKTVL